MWKLLGTPKATPGDSQAGSSPRHRSATYPSTPLGRQGSQALQRTDQDAGGLQQLCDRISAFVYGECDECSQLCLPCFLNVESCSEFAFARDLQVLQSCPLCLSGIYSLHCTSAAPVKP